MSTADKLTAALSAVDWNANVASFCGDTSAAAAVAEQSLRVAIWAKQFEAIDRDNPAICFVREMQIACQTVAVTIALAAYKSAASAMRSVVETALYYTYFRTHHAELATLVNNDKWYMSKTEIIEYHNQHTPDFSHLQSKLQLLQLFNPWYAKISAIVHGQIPGVWHAQKSIADVKRDVALQAEAIRCFEECVEVIHRLFLCTAGREMWATFSSPAKSALTHGMSGEIRLVLGIDRT